MTSIPSRRQLLEGIVSNKNAFRRTAYGKNNKSALSGVLLRAH